MMDKWIPEVADVPTLTERLDLPGLHPSGEERHVMGGPLDERHCRAEMRPGSGVFCGRHRGHDKEAGDRGHRQRGEDGGAMWGGPRVVEIPADEDLKLAIETEILVTKEGALSFTHTARMSQLDFQHTKTSALTPEQSLAIARAIVERQSAERGG